VEKAGDFRQLSAQLRRIGRPETEANAQKAGISGPFSRLLGSLAERRNGWLTIQGSNSHIPDWDKPFEMPGQFRLIPSKFRGGDFCTCQLQILGTHPSLMSET
jgi:hypothetical protein